MSSISAAYAKASQGLGNVKGAIAEARCGKPQLTAALRKLRLSSLLMMECYRHKFICVNILIILYDEPVFNRFFYYLGNFYVLSI